MAKRAITFTATREHNGVKVWTNLETQVEIYFAGSWYVEYPIQGTDVINTWYEEESFPTLPAARAIARRRAEQIRSAAAEAYDQAHEEDRARSGLLTQ